MKNIFIDMDGVLAEYKKDCTEETLRQKDYFLNLKPEENMLQALSLLIDNCESLGVNIFVLTKVYPTLFKYSISEKEQWRDKYMPYLFDSEFIMVNGETQEKSDAICELLDIELNEDCVLIDDYNHNLADWRKKGGTAVKYVNEINDKNKSFVGNRITYSMTPLDIYQTLLNIVGTVNPTPFAA